MEVGVVNQHRLVFVVLQFFRLAEAGEAIRRDKRMDDLVGIVVPVLHRSSLIGRALDRILQQTYNIWEVVVVDDRSTDDTAAAVAEQARKEPRVRLVQHDRIKGAHAALNTGMPVARGKWIAFLDSDDQLLPDGVEKKGYGWRPRRSTMAPV